jgi:glycosyltransferase involved in cell wall biosynthesis
VSTYPPRRCGVASFTHALAAAAGGREIAALLTPERGTPYPLEVHHRIRQDEPADYVNTARDLGRCVDVVAVQHEPTIWGGEDGESVLDFLGALELPAVATLHTVRSRPTERQRTILREVVQRSAATVVMSKSAAELLSSTYGLPKTRIEVIPHGVPDLPVQPTDTIKAGLGVDGHDVILAFGLVGPDKGLELVLDALPAVIKARPTALLAIVGPTHPDLVRDQGETYREALVARAQTLGISSHVRFVDKFIGRVEMTRWLQAADVVVTAYPNLDQTVSGTLSAAMGAGRAVVSTAYPYATELLADGRGVVVEAATPARFSAAVVGVLADDEARAAMGRRAHQQARAMTWTQVGDRYRRLFDTVAAARPAATPVTRPVPLKA